MNTQKEKTKSQTKPRIECRSSAKLRNGVSDKTGTNIPDTQSPIKVGSKDLKQSVNTVITSMPKSGSDIQTEKEKPIRFEDFDIYWQGVQKGRREAYEAGKYEAIKQVMEIESILLKECDSAVENAKGNESLMNCQLAYREGVIRTFKELKSKLGELAK